MPRGFLCDDCKEFHQKGAAASITYRYTPVLVDTNGDLKPTHDGVHELTLCATCANTMYVQYRGQLPNDHEAVVTAAEEGAAE